jgi:hypothetical protein
MFYFAFPAKLIFIRGARIKPYQMIEKPFDEITYDDLDYLRNKIHQTMQSDLDIAVREYGQDPFAWAEFFEVIQNNLSKLLFFIPFSWAFIFHEHDRRYYEMQQKLKEYSEDTPKNKAIRKRIIKEQQEQIEDESIWGLTQNVISTVASNPQVLMLYLPIGGLFDMLWKGFDKN